MYMPTVARFTSRDPLPQDGAPVLLGTWYWYAKNAPNMFIDPNGMLEIDPVKPFPTKMCKCNGERIEYQWDFSLPKNAEKYCDGGSGYFVQRVRIWCDEKECDSCGGCPNPPVKFGPPDSTVYEAWEVEAGSNIAKVRANGKANYTDSFSFSCNLGVCGYRITIGEVRFFCKNDMTNPPPPFGKQDPNGQWDSKLIFGKKCRGQTGGLPATEDEEVVKDFWPKKSKTVAKSHELWCTYECCDKPNCDCRANPQP